MGRLAAGAEPAGHRAQRRPEREIRLHDWAFKWLDAHADPATGYWAGKTPNRVHQLGGAFHMYHLYACFGREWPYAARVVDATLASQRADGMWHPPPSTCIDLDGIYSLTRSARFVIDKSTSTPYRWADVRGACEKYLRTAAAMLNNASIVLGNGGGGEANRGYAQNSHLMHGALYAVAECQMWFPDLVRTVRPWRRAKGDVSDVSCAYA